VKTVVVICCISLLIASAALVPIDESDGKAKVLVEESNIDNKGNYDFKYATDDGARRQETGKIKNSYLKVQGAYEFVGDDGETYIIRYEADEKGYRPVLEKA